MKIVACPRNANPYQSLLYGALAARGARVRYVCERTPSHTVNLLLLPLELVLARLAGWRVLHIHWVFGFAFTGSSRSPSVRRLSQVWFGLVLGLARLVGMRVVWTAHNVLPHEAVFYDDVTARRALVAACDLVLAHTQAALDGLREIGAEPTRAVLVPLASVTPSAEPPPPGAGGGLLRLLFFGKVAAYKGVEELLQAVARLPAEPSVELTVCGEIADRDLRARLRAAAEGLEPRVRLRLERLSDAELAVQLAACDAVVLPFRRVTTSTSVLHAMAYGRVVVVPDLPSFEAVPQDTLVRYDGSVGGLARTLAWLAGEERGRLAQMGSAAARYARGFSWDGVAERTLAALRALEGPAARGSDPTMPAAGRGKAPSGVPERVPEAADRKGLIGGVVEQVRRETLYRGSLLLVANSVLLALFGFVFWAVAARLYDVTAVGLFSGVSAAVVMLATVASLGLPNTMLRHLAGSEDPRGLLAAALVSVTTLGAAVCLAAVELLGPSLPADLQLDRPAGGAGLLVGLVALAAANAVTDAGLIAISAPRLVLVKNLAGSVAKVAVVAPLAGLDTKGLVLAYGAGTALSAVAGAVLLWRRLRSGHRRPALVAAVRPHLSFSAGNYLGVMLGILPLTVVPLIVLAELGPDLAARFAVAYLLVGFVNFIPSAAAQVLFAELSRPGESRTVQLRKALKAVYALLLPASVVLLAAAPLLLGIFGPDYAEATGALRVLALGTLFTGGTYLVDVILTGTDRVGAYVFMNGLNAALVLAGVAVGAQEGLTAVALGWSAAQAVSLLAGIVLLVATRAMTQPRRGGPSGARGAVAAAPGEPVSSR
jgi:O-antigen/teichoic acid export membrane protein/glycosyltransferase involved in cell wall biosynthesis